MAPGDYKWNTDSRDERQSEFKPSVFASTASDDAAHGKARRRAARRRRVRLAVLLGSFVGVVALSAALLYGVSKILHG